MAQLLARLALTSRRLLPAAATIALAAPAPAALLFDQRFDSWDDEHRGADIGDLNGDGHMDVVATNFRTGRFTVRLGDGAGGFTASLGPAVGELPIGVRLGDMDGDGDLDVVTANLESNTIAVCANDGAGTFGAPTSYSVFTPHSLDLGDIDGDDDLDVVIADNGSGFVWFLTNDGDGDLNGPTELFIGSDEPAGGIKLADLDGDDDLDLVTTLRNSGTTLVALNQNGAFVPDVQYPTPGATAHIDVGDVDGDDLPDIAIAGTQFVLLRNVGNGQFVPEIVDTVVALDVHLTDLDADGDLDAVFATTFCMTIMTNTGGAFDVTTTLSPQRAIEQSGFALFTHTTRPWVILSDDVDDDGAVDLLTVSSGSLGVNSQDFVGYVSVFKNDGAGDFGATAPIAVGGGSAFNGGQSFVAVADLDEDGMLDIVTSSDLTDEVTVVLNDVMDAPSFPHPTHPSYPVGRGPVRLAIDDLDADTHDDLVVANRLDASVSVMIGDGAGGFGPETRVDTFILPLDVALGDLDDDGRPDAVVGHEFGASVSVLRNAGGGSFESPLLVDTGLASTDAIALRDMDGDGALDIIVASRGIDFASEPGVVTVLRNTGGLSFEVITTNPVGLDTVALAAADFDGDGRIDVVTLDQDDAVVSLLTNVGGGVLGARVTHPVVGTARHLTAADLDLDGDVDLAIANGDFTFSVLVNEAGTFERSDHIPSSPDESTYATLWESGTVAVGDVNGDQRPDVVLADALIEQVVVTNNVSNVDVTPPCVGDLDGSGHVGFDDLLDLLSQWGSCSGGSCSGDLDGNGSVGFNDVTMLLNAWGPCP